MPALLLTAALVGVMASNEVQGGQGRARAIVSGSISEADYPAEALRAGAEGTTVVELAIDQGGRVTGCRVAQSAGNAALDQRTCDVVSQRFRFAAAPTALGRRMRIDWRLPAAPPPVPFAPARATVETISNNSGTNYCRVSTVGLPPAALYGIGCDPSASNGAMPRYWQTRRVDSFTLVSDGRSPPAMSGNRGTVLMRYQVSFDVGADGAVTRCEPANASEEAVRAAARERCDALANGGRPTFEAAGGGSVRHGRIDALTVLQAR